MLMKTFKVLIYSILTIIFYATKVQIFISFLHLFNKI